MSQHAGKRLKSLFHLAALAAIRAKGQLQDYYQRKVKEGVPRRDKNKRLVLNAVRNKPPGGPVIHRLYAVVKPGEKYEKNYAFPLV